MTKTPAMPDPQPAEVSDESAYNLIDRFLRNNLHDDDYAEYSQALDILALRPQAVPMTEDKLVACLVKANCIGVVKMSYDSGPYCATRPSINASKLKEAIEAHHGITQRAKEPR